MNYTDITLETDQRGVAWLTLNRPQKHNAMGSRMMQELAYACEAISGDNAEFCEISIDENFNWDNI